MPDNISQSARRRCIIIEPFLTGFAGHSFSVCRALKTALEKHGVEVLILANSGTDRDLLDKLGAVPVFRPEFIGEDTEFPCFSPATFKRLWLAYRHGTADLKKGFPSDRLRPGDIIFAYTMTTNWVLPMWRWARRSPYRDGLRIVWQFFFPLAAEGTGFWNRLLFRRFYRWLFAGLSREFKAERLLLCSDTEFRAGEYSRATGFKFAVLPMATENHRLPPAADRHKKIRLSSLGPARTVKGIGDIVDLAIKLREPLKSGDIEIFIQVNEQPAGDPIVKAAIGRLKQAGLPQVIMTDQELTPEEYQAALAATDIMLLPYDPKIYGQARTSGVFAEAISNGIPMIVPRHTWTAEQAERYNTGGSFVFGNAASFEAAVLKMIAKYPEYRERALGAAHKWKQDHGADALAAKITGDQKPSESGYGNK